MNQFVSREVRIPATDGYSLAGSIYSKSDAGPVVLLCPAVGVKRRFYATLASYLAERGMTVVTFDYRGIGGSRPRVLRGFAARLRDWSERDFEGVVRWARHEHPGRRITVVGHSAGGWHCGLAPSGNMVERAVTICTSSADWRLWQTRWWWLTFAIWYLMIPIVTRLCGYLPGRLMTGSDLPRGVALEWSRWARTPGCFMGPYEGIEKDGFTRLRIPILSFSFSDDLFAPERGVDALHALFENAAIARRHLRPGDVGLRKVGHIGFFQARARDTLWPEVAAFLLS
jgi:predicted alpha/beta hydrolase